MKKVILKTYGKIIAWFLTALGLYTSCDIPNPRAEYGTPSADFVIKGNVIDKESRQPVKGMAVINKSDYVPYGNNTVRSDANGNYEMNFKSMYFNSDIITVYTSDTDGEENGAYQSDTIRIKTIELKQIAKRRGWYEGKFEGKADFELKRSTQAPMYGPLSADYLESEEE